MKLKWFIKSACALVLAFALAFSFSTVLAKPKQSKKPKLWYYEKDMLTFDFKNYKRMFYTLARVNNQHGVGALSEVTNDVRFFFYNGTIVKCDEPPQPDGLTFIDFNFSFPTEVHKNYLNFKVSKKDKVNYVWGVVKEDVSLYDKVVLKNTPFHVLGIQFNDDGIDYIIETPEFMLYMPMHLVSIVQK